MSTNTNLLRGYLGEMLAAEKYLLQLVNTQLDTTDITRHPETGPVLEPLRDALEVHTNRLAAHLEQSGGVPANAGIREAVSVLGGKLAGLFEKIRSDTASRMLRDTYCALHLVNMSYTMLHSTALALHDQRTAELALQHLRDLTELTVELSRAVPHVVVNELADQHDGADRTVAALASDQTHEAWSAVSVTSGSAG